MRNLRRLSFLLLAVAAVLLLQARVPAQSSGVGAPRSISLRDPGWKLDGNVRVEPHLGREALHFGTGTAAHGGTPFRDGTIEFDLATSSLRTFFGLRFRAESDEAFEEIYFRPHKSGLPDAVQYAPAFAGGRSNWQLWHGPADTGSARFTPGSWTHVRIAFAGDRAAAYLGGEPKPVLIARLAREPRAGTLAFWSLNANPPDRTGLVSAISNVVVRPGAPAEPLPEPPAAETPPAGVIARWSVSKSFALPDSGAVLELPSEVLRGAWRSASADASGLVALDRFVESPKDAERVGVLARVRLRTERPVVVPLRFGYSDDVSVFVNGRPLFSGVYGYSYNFPRRDGLITIDQGALYLPLGRGDNEIIFAVSEVFGGWGLMAALPERAALTVLE